MRISDITCTVVNAGMRNWIFVKVQTDEAGLHGWGEATLEWKTKSVVASVDDLKLLLIGEDPRDISRCREIMRKQSYWRLGAIGRSAVSGIELALWDILGKELGAPVWRLLGGKVRDKIRVYTHLGMGDMDAVYHSFSREKVVDHCEALKARGYKAAKIVNVPYSHYMQQPGAVANFADAIHGLRNAVGDDFSLMIDFHGRPASPRVALEYIWAVEDAAIAFVEEPIQPGDHKGLAFLRQQSKIPIASGERLIEPDEFERTLSRRAVDIIQPDLCHCGGLSEARRIAEHAAILGIGVAPHNPAGPVASAAAAHFAAATPNHVIQEEMSGAVPWFERVVSKSPIKMVSGFWDIPEGPGLGIEIDEEAASKHPFEPESIQPRNAVMDDGTIVDW